MNELRARATMYITIEENTKAARRTKMPMMTSIPKRKRLNKFNYYTSLNANRNVVIQEAYNLELVRMSQPMQTSPSANHSKRC